MKEKINVVYITDETYAMPTCVSIVSAIKSAGEDDALDFWVLCNEVTDESKAKFKNLCIDNDDINVHIIEVQNEEYVELAQSCLTFPYIHVSSAALFKFNLPSILANLEKVIYVDGDTLIRKSLNELYNWNIEDVWVAAVDDAIDKIRGGIYSSRVGRTYFHYFNSGVMLLNLEKMRRDKVTERLIDYRINRKNYFMDQDALNAVLKKKRSILPYTYNFMSTITDNLDLEGIIEEFKLDNKISLEQFIDSVVIIHLTDVKKPWVYNIPWYTDIFMKYYNISPYKNTKLDLKSPLKVLEDKNQLYKKSIKVLQKQLEKSQLMNQKLLGQNVQNQAGIDCLCWNVIKGHKIALYGAGKRGRRIYASINENNWCDIVLWCDKNHKAFEEGIDCPEKLEEAEFDYVLITIVDEVIALEVKLELAKNYRIDISKILTIYT